MGNASGKEGLLQEKLPAVQEQEQQYTYTLKGESGLMGLAFEVSDQGACFDDFIDDNTRSKHQKMMRGDRLLSVNGISLTGMEGDEVMTLLEDLHDQPKVLVLEASLLLPTEDDAETEMSGMADDFDDAAE